MAPNWDSWGKIRILGGTFDAEVVSKAWEADIQLRPGDEASHAVAQYEEWCRDPNSGGLALIESAMDDGTSIAVESEDPQEFLERQLKILEAFKAKTPAAGKTASSSSAANGSSPSLRRAGIAHVEEKSVNEHIGPVQFNMGGIQVDADDMLQRLKVYMPYILPRPFCLSPGWVISCDFEPGVLVWSARGKKIDKELGP